MEPTRRLMKLETFFEKFDQFADAPDAVEKMRGLVLRLSANGVPHTSLGQRPRKTVLRLVPTLKVRHNPSACGAMRIVKPACSNPSSKLRKSAMLIENPATQKSKLRRSIMFVEGKK
jgi:hypothetical protein